MPMLFCHAILLFAIASPLYRSANGYLIGRVMGLQNPSSLSGGFELDDAIESQYAPTYLLVSRRSDPAMASLSPSLRSLRSTYSPSTEFPAAKKSTHTGYYKSLKKFNGNGSRNCFFTPVQCILQHDIAKFKSLVDSNPRPLAHK